MINIIYDIIVFFMIHDIISYVRLQLLILPRHSADANDSGHERDADLDRPMDADEERDYADQDPLSDMDMEEDAEILATLLQHIPSYMNADDIEQLLQDIPVQPPVVVPVRTVQEAIEDGDIVCII
jgi:hypothetical protein